MRKWQKHLVFSFLLVLVMSSCAKEESKIPYDFIVRNITGGPIGKVTFKFDRINGSTVRRYAFTVDTEKTESKLIPLRMKYTGMEYSIESEIMIYPWFDDLPNGGKIEIIAYYRNPEVLKTESGFEMKAILGVLAYKVCFVKNDTVITVISKDNKLDISDCKTTDPENSFYYSDFSDITLIRSYDQPRLPLLKENGNVMGAYLIKSEIDGSMLWLN